MFPAKASYELYPWLKVTVPSTLSSLLIQQLQGDYPFAILVAVSPNAEGGRYP